MLLAGESDTFVVYMDGNVNYFYSVDVTYGNIEVTIRKHENAE